MAKMATLEMSPQDKIKAVKGEKNQANYLINAKERNSEKKRRGISITASPTKK